MKPQLILEKFDVYLNPNWPNYVESQVKVLAEKSGYEF